ncbi:MAG TPA: choice-of-anchor D domain-containing protein [Solirubrobacterales bacterium]|nr:choice-of-anchor D domain-containing protein [Solirubrobacterales bacterium]
MGALATFAFACLLMASPSLASAGWTSPATVSGPGTSVSQTTVAGGSDGTSWVVWKRDVGGFNLIQGTRVQIDGTQGPIVTLSPVGQNANNPVIASRADGSAVVGWTNESGTSDFIQSVSIAADGTVAAVTDRSVNGPAGQDASDLAIAVGADGTAGLAWLRFDGTEPVVQAVRVASDGSSGTVHNLSAASAAPGPPDVGAAPPTTAGDPYFYRVMWPQGSAATSQVANADVMANDTVTTTVLLYTNASGADCADPFDIQIAYGSDGAMNAFWVCYKKTIDFNTFNTFYNWSVQWLRTAKGVPLSTGGAASATNASPTIYLSPYPISGVVAAESFTGQPAIAWIHDLDGGGQRVETWRIMINVLNGVPLPVGQGWANTTTEATAVGSPAIAVNSNNTGIAGGVELGALPGQNTTNFTRFSNSSYDPVTPSGGFTYSEDPGYVLTDGGKTLAAFTGITGPVGSAMVMTFEDPGISVDPDSFNFGHADIGTKRSVSISIRSTGQTTNTVTGITLGGANADRYAMSGADDCIREMTPNTNCRFTVTFTPGSTASQTAQISVTSDGGNEVANLTGTGLNRTRNSITAKPGHAARRKGKVVRIRVKASNLGGVSSNNTRICVNLRKRALKLAGNRCRNLGTLGVGATRNLNYRIRVTWRAQRGVKLPVTFVLRSNNTVVRQAVVQLRRKGR